MGLCYVYHKSEMVLCYALGTSGHILLYRATEAPFSSILMS